MISFYPLISKNLLINAINFATSIPPIDKKSIKTILHTHKSILFNKNKVWVKKDNSDFDVTMDSSNVTEVCEIVGLYLLYILRKEFRLLRCPLWFTNWKVLVKQESQQWTIIYLQAIKPPIIYYQILAMISKRKSNISCDKEW